MFKPTSSCFRFGTTAALALLCAALLGTSPAAALTTNQHAGKAKTEQVAKRPTPVAHTRSVAHAGSKKKAAKKATTPSAHPAHSKTVHATPTKASSRGAKPMKSKPATHRT